MLSDGRQNWVTATEGNRRRSVAARDGDCGGSGVDAPQRLLAGPLVRTTGVKNLSLLNNYCRYSVGAPMIWRARRANNAIETFIQYVLRLNATMARKLLITRYRRGTPTGIGTVKWHIRVRKAAHRALEVCNSRTGSQESNPVGRRLRRPADPTLNRSIPTVVRRNTALLRGGVFVCYGLSQRPYRVKTMARGIRPRPARVGARCPRTPFSAIDSIARNRGALL